jgi:hypothetical protein
MNFTAGTIDYRSILPPIGAGSINLAARTTANAGSSGTLADLGNGKYRLTLPIQVTLTTNLPLGSSFTLTARGTVVATGNVPPLPPPLPPAPRSLKAALEVVKKTGKAKRQKIVVRYADTGEIKAQFNAPFQGPAFRKVVVVALDTDGDGVPDTVQVTARRFGMGKKRFTRLFALYARRELRRGGHSAR